MTLDYDIIVRGNNLALRDGYLALANATLVFTPDGPLLFDTGHYCNRPTLLSGLQHHGLAPGDVRAVFLSHLHFDHCGWNTRRAGGEVLPTFIATSTRTAIDLWISLAGFIGFYTFLLVIEIYLMFKFARLGPSSLHTGRYYHERAAQGGGSTLAAQPMAPHKD